MFDEVHYLRDKERGVVWEQAIVLTPPSVNFVFLSATLPNAREFASWIAKIHRCWILCWAFEAVHGRVGFLIVALQYRAASSTRRVSNIQAAWGRPTAHPAHSLLDRGP